MAKSARDVLNQITMINNIKYNNNNNNNNYTNIVSKESNEEEVMTSSLSGLASLSASQKPLGEALASSGTLPSKWRGVKLDLFANPKHTLKITIIRHDGTRFACSANLNSPRSYVFRGREQGQGTKYHWQLVEYLMEIRDDYDYKISKVGKPRKGGTIKDFVSMIYFTDNIWNVDLVYEHRIWNFKLDKETSQAFRDKNGIASGYIGITGYNKPWQESEELGI
jgi:hypothetical protein